MVNATISKVFIFLDKCYNQCVSKNGNRQYSWMTSPLLVFGKTKVISAELA